MKLKSLLLATLLPCTLASQKLAAEDRDTDKPDGCRTGVYYTIDSEGRSVGHTYISVVDPKDGTGLGVSVGDDGKHRTFLITPDITIQSH